jgi:hypothetical protein
VLWLVLEGVGTALGGTGDGEKMGRILEGLGTADMGIGMRNW